MPRADGPHTRNQKAAVVYRGSKRRLERVSPFEELTLNFWVFLTVGVVMLALCGVLIYRAL
jgi:hypothetical protein